MKVVGNKVKGRILKRKTNTRTCAYQGVRNVRFSENLARFVFLKHPFWDMSFCLITDEVIAVNITETLVHFCLSKKNRSGKIHEDIIK